MAVQSSNPRGNERNIQSIYEGVHVMSNTTLGAEHVKDNTRNRTKQSFSKPSTLSSTNATTLKQNASGHRSTSSTARTSLRHGKGFSPLSARRPIPCTMKANSSSQKETMSSRTAVSPEWEGPRPGLPLTSSDLKTVSWPSTGMYCKTKPHRQSPSAAFHVWGHIP
jgi:hypothetical protein